VFRLQLLLIDTDKFLATPGVFSKTVVGDPVKPGRETGFPAKTANMFVSAHKSFLRQIIGQGKIGAGELAKQTSHSRLMPTNELAKGVVIIIDKNSRDEVRIS